PMGFDAFGLPTERYCMTTGIHPTVATEKNISTFKRQLDMIGLGYDWDQSINTTEPEYYKWTQLMFTKIYNSWFDKETNKARHIDELPIPAEITGEKEIAEYQDEKRLAYISMKPVNWCEELGTVLANEEVDEWRGKGYSVERKPMRQWMIKITEYAQRLLDDLDLVDWPHSTMEMQKNWIGKSEGADVIFKIKGSDKTSTVFTTRPDTLFGANYLVLAPEHELVAELTTDDQQAAVKKYIHETNLKSDLERQEVSKDKTGVFTGAYAINPGSGKEVPIWIADYVLAHYGTGAIMAVPGHDPRDHEFAKAFNLPITQVVKPKKGDWDIQAEALVDKGIAMNSAGDSLNIDGMPTGKAKYTTIKWLEENSIGEGKVQFKLRDWLFSRQRYWGEPMPIMFFEDGSRRCLDEDELPLRLPEVDDFQPAGTGESPLAKVESWINFIDKKTGKKARFETNTMPQWAGSCWYYLRYIDPKNKETFCDPEKEKYWMGGGGVDLYVGGSEHAVLHLLYARFWHKVLLDYGMVSTPEPFKKLFHQGLIIGADGRKMSKSLGNVVNPDDIIKSYGADSLRLYEMFLGPLGDSKPWAEKGIEGVNRFLKRVWRMIADKEDKLSSSIQNVEPTAEQDFVLHSTIMKVAEDIENLHFNTAISQMMIFVNEFYKHDVKPRAAIEKFVLCLAPFAPHIAEELWQLLGHEESIVFATYPEHDASKIVKTQIQFVVQVQSKIRARIDAPANLTQEEYEEIALKDDRVQKFIGDKTIRKRIYVPNKLINFIVG
ncbi:MAG: leucine--tRNA ligase, partial [Chlorobi bacterium]|nr:leucine--tRNA ligase [Chlorobiota bacterium]